MFKLGNQTLFESERVVQDVNVKISSSTTYDLSSQVICLVLDSDVLLFRFVDELESKTRALNFFKDNGKKVQDIYFNPSSGSWLLVVTFDNTIHVVPIYNLLNDEDSSLANQVFNSHTVTSFIVPFIGPHDCSNSRTCPNEIVIDAEVVIAFEEDHQPCPYPTSVCWWQCVDGRDRAIIGYNDGCICFVDLSPNAPYITNLRMDEAVLKLDIFRDLKSELFYLLVSKMLLLRKALANGHFCFYVLIIFDLEFFH